MWKEIIAVHNDQSRKEIAHYRGREIRTTGDGFQAIFGGLPDELIFSALVRSVRSAHSLGLEIRAGFAHGGGSESVDVEE